MSSWGDSIFEQEVSRHNYVIRRDAALTLNLNIPEGRSYAEP